MLLRCVRATAAGVEIGSLPNGLWTKQAFHLTVGKDYVVIGLQFALGSNLHGTGVWVHLVTDSGHLGWAPLSFFEILNGAVSRLWEVRSGEYGVTLWPASLYRPYYHDDLSEGVPEIVEDFDRVRLLIEAEAAEDLRGMP